MINLDDKTVNERLSIAGIKVTRGHKKYHVEKSFKKHGLYFQDPNPKKVYSGWTFSVMEYNGVCVMRPRIGWLEDVQEVCLSVFDLNI